MLPSSAPRPLLRVAPTDVGRRVTLRRVLPDAAPLPDGRPPLGDVVGVLEGWEDGRLRVRRSDGEVVVVAEDALVLGRVVRPRREPHP